jgi:alpha-mannosidase
MINNPRYALSLNETYGLDINSAMISDVPGYSWGMVESLAQNGIKYFSSGPNHMPHLPHGGYQVGHSMETWGDVPLLLGIRIRQAKDSFLDDDTRVFMVP